jgi:hypothetical protein
MSGGRSRPVEIRSRRTCEEVEFPGLVGLQLNLRFYVAGTRIETMQRSFHLQFVGHRYMDGGSLGHAHERAGNLCWTVGLSKGLHVKHRAVFSLGMPGAIAQLEFQREDAILQFACGSAVLVGNNPRSRRGNLCQGDHGEETHEG